MHQSFLIIRSRGGVYAARRVRFIGLTRAQLQMLSDGGRSWWASWRGRALVHAPLAVDLGPRVSRDSRVFGESHENRRNTTRIRQILLASRAREETRRSASFSRDFEDSRLLRRNTASETPGETRREKGVERAAFVIILQLQYILQCTRTRREQDAHGRTRRTLDQI
jgi:hypothetical protein